MQNYAPYPLVAPNLNGVPNFYPHSQGPQAPVAAPASTDHVHKTTTVRNLVNLKKPTLTVKPCADKPHLLRVAFSFDAVSPCRCAPCHMSRAMPYIPGIPYISTYTSTTR